MPKSEKIAAFLRELQAAQSDSGATVELLLRRLDASTAEMIRRAAIPHQFDIEALSVLFDAGLPQEVDLDAIYHRIVQFSMVSASGDEFRLHDTARAHLFFQWLSPERRELFADLSGRLARHYAIVGASRGGADRRAMRLREIYHLIGADIERGFLSFEKEFRSARLRFALAECGTLLNLVREYEPILNPAQRLRLTYLEALHAADNRDWDNAVPAFQSVASNASASPDLRACALIRLGGCHTERRSWDEAERAYREAEPFAARSGPGEHSQHDLTVGLSALHRERGDLDTALALAMQAVTEAERLADADALATSRNLLGTVYMSYGEPGRAIPEFEESLRQLDGTQDRSRRAQVLNNLGLAYVELSYWEQARDALEQALAIEVERGDTLGQARIHNNLVRVFVGLGDVARGICAAEVAARSFLELHDFYRAALARRNLGRILRRAGRRDDARKVFSEAAAYFESAGAAQEAVAVRKEMTPHSPRWPWFLFAVALIPLIALVFVVVAEFVLPPDQASTAPGPDGVASGPEDWPPPAIEAIDTVAVDGDPVQAVIAAGAGHWLRFRTEAFGIYSVHVGGSDGLASRLWVYRSADLALIGFAEEGGSASDHEVRFALEPSDYLIHVSALGEGRGSLSLWVTRVASVRRSGEVSVDGPVQIGPGMFDGAVNEAGSLALFMITVDMPTGYAIRVHGEAAFDPIVVLLAGGTEGRFIAANNDESPETSDAYVVHHFEPGRYILAVAEFDGNSGPFRITVEEAP